MRPPQNAGKTEQRPLALVAERLASMRPPQNAGEDLPRHQQRHFLLVASMRPPQNAGEDTRCRRSSAKKAWLQ